MLPRPMPSSDPPPIERKEIMLPVLRFDLSSGKAAIEKQQQPTEEVKGIDGVQYWLYASNNKYAEQDIARDKTGKWMLFYPSEQINVVWENVKKGIKNGHLWHAKVSTLNPKDKTHAIMIYTKDYSDKQDVMRVLAYLEESQLKPAGRRIRYKTDAQTRAGIYRGGRERPWVYCSSTIRQLSEPVKHAIPVPSKSDALWWRSKHRFIEKEEGKKLVRAPHANEKSSASSYGQGYQPGFFSREAHKRTTIVSVSSVPVERTKKTGKKMAGNKGKEMAHVGIKL